jgi:hypothetical protein
MKRQIELLLAAIAFLLAICLVAFAFYIPGGVALAIALVLWIAAPAGVPGEQQPSRHGHG